MQNNRSRQGQHGHSKARTELSELISNRFKTIWTNKFCKNSLNVNAMKGLVNCILNIPCMYFPFLYVYTVNAILI